MACDQAGLASRIGGCQPSTSTHCLQDDAQDRQQTASIQHERVKGSSHALSLWAKYGLSNGELQNCVSSQQAHVHDHNQPKEFLANHAEIMHLQQDDEMKRSTSIESLHGKNTYLVSDNHHTCDSEDDRHVKRDNTDNESLSHHQVSHANHSTNGRETTMASTLQTARANAAELRALHAAVLNGQINLGSTVRNSMEQQWHPMPVNNHLGQKQSRAKNEKSIYDHRSSTFGVETKEDIYSRPSSISSTSSTTDCFIRPFQEYPVFVPHSKEDMLLTSIVDDMNSSNRCSSVDPYEAAMQEERLQYIFDHENKRSFSHSYSDRQHARKNGISCLHESLNLPPKSASALIYRRHNDGQQLQHTSLNLPQGSQQHLFKASTMQNPLFESQETMQIKQKSSRDHLNEGSACSLFLKNYSEDMEGRFIRKKSGDQTLAHPQESALHDLTSRQRALIEFLSEEPARMRAFNELAAKQTASRSEAHLCASIQEDMATEGPSKEKENFMTTAWNADQLTWGRAEHQHLSHQKPVRSGIPGSQRLPQTSSDGHLHQPNNIVSCDKCRPAPSGVVPRPDSTESRKTDPSTSAAMADGQDRLKKHSSIKSWFFKSRKKQQSTDHHVEKPSRSAHVASAVPGKSHSQVITDAGKYPASKEHMSTSNITDPTSAPTSRVFPSLATSDTEKELEVAMAMDLMELKVLQANTKRDAAMAEVLELRLAIDSMAKKLVEVERQCESLQTQLQRTHVLPYLSGGNPVGRWMPPPATEDEVAAAHPADDNHGEAIRGAEDDFCESDSHGHREERKVAFSNVRSGLSVKRPGYGGGVSSSRRVPNPSKEEFLSAVAEARVGVKQVSRVVLQQVQERMGKGATLEMAGEDAELWRPVVTMCRAEEEAGGSRSRGGREVGFCIEALISLAFYEHFENVGFNKSGAHHILDPVQRATAFYHAFLKLAKLAPTQLLTQPSALYSPPFDRFCSRKLKAMGRAVGCPRRLWPDELTGSFLSAARAVWLLHHLAFAYSDGAPAIFRVAVESPFDRRFMELLPALHQHHPPHPRHVSLMVMPGFFLCDDVIKCKVLAS